MVSELTQLADLLDRSLLFVSGKGGVGKTTISRAIASKLASQGKKTLWVTLEDPSRPPGELKQTGSFLWELNCDPFQSFEEFIGTKIKIAPLAKLFLNNRFMRYLARSAPGIPGLVMLGKILHERENFDHVVVDMASTGHGLSMFQSTQNFASLFQGGVVSRDAKEMIGAVNDPQICGNLVVALPEEMPLVEALEFEAAWKKLFPMNPSVFLLNRAWPDSDSAPKAEPEKVKENESTPFPKSATEYAMKRGILEKENLKLWEGIHYDTIEFFPPTEKAPVQLIASALGAATSSEQGSV